MPTVKDRIFDVLRAHGSKAMFGNPGSTELPILNDFPQDFSYFLGLQEASVVAMATGYALLRDNASISNLHTTAGTGNAMGAIVTAMHAQAPLIITAGQQDRRMIRSEPFLWGKQVEFVKPYVKWSVEPHRSVDVPEAIERAYHISMTEPRGPVFVSIPMDGLDEECAPVEIRHVSYRVSPDREEIVEVASLLSRGSNVALLVGEEVDASGAMNEAVELAERLEADVFLSPLCHRWGFPSRHPLFRGRLPPAMGLLSSRLEAYDTVLVVGAPVFLYYPYVPGKVIKEKTQVIQLTCDASAASRALTGLSVLGNVKLGLELLLKEIASLAQPKSEKPRRTKPASSSDLSLGSKLVEDEGKDSSTVASRLPDARAVHEQLARSLSDDVVIFEEDPSSEVYFRGKITRHKSHFTTASGGLGFAMPAAVGAALALDEEGEGKRRPVICIVGEGSAQYSIQALWSARQYKARVTFIVFNNSEYAILKSFGMLLGVKNVPGLDIPGIDFEGLARGYGVGYTKVETAEELAKIVKDEISSQRGPSLLEIAVSKEVLPLLG
jgi:benzoylformate decarboxylase